MPTNLPPEYFEVEKRYKAATSIKEKIESLEELIGTIPKHKGTDKLRADLRRRLSKLKDNDQTKKGAGKQETAFHIEKEGAARVLVIGSTNVGKSSLIAKVTHANPKISASPFTTWFPTPGMMPIKDIQIQLIDTPPINREFTEPELFTLMQSSDLLLLMIDLQNSPTAQLEETLRILEEHRIIQLSHKKHYQINKHFKFFPFLFIVNKYDNENYNEDFEILCELLEYPCPLFPISVTNSRNLDILGEKIYEKLEIMRIYSKPPGKEPDLGQPFVLKKGSTIEEFASKVHKDFSQRLKTARIWGTGVYDGQMVGKDHVLNDEDIVELHL
jgi:ribosome-interacting GTPase 1